MMVVFLVHWYMTSSQILNQFSAKMKFHPVQWRKYK